VRLIHYLCEHGHWAPFSHPQVSMHVKAPIAVVRQCFKHKVGFAESEVSRRYVDDEPEFYMPDVWRGRPVDKKQGSSGVVLMLEHEVGQEDLWGDVDNGWAPALHVSYANQAALDMYRWLLRSGVAPEHARLVLPQSMMTEWFWTGSLAAWARFHNQRNHADAQEETAVVARQASEIIGGLFPVSWPALIER
jgi:thymidylate synthase (FAD)